VQALKAAGTLNAALIAPGAVSGLIAPAGHSGSHTPQSIHSVGLITSMFSPS
jgi:hypothetical protein